MTLPPIEVRGRSSQIVKVLVPASVGGVHGVATAKGTGSFLYVVDAPAPIRVRLDQNAWIDARTGTSLKCVDGSGFEGVEIENAAAVAIVVSLYIGFAEYRDDRETILEQPTECYAAANAAGWNGTELAANANLVLTGIRTGNLIRRKAVQIFNNDAAAAIYVFDVNNRRTAIVLPLSAITMPISGYVRVNNPSGAAAVDCAISEIWWVR